MTRHSLFAPALAALLAITTAKAFGASTFDCLVEPTQSVEIGSPVTGLLERVNVRRGDRVAKGQVIAMLEAKAETASTALALYKSEMSGPTRAAENKIDFSQRKFQRRRDMQSASYMSAQERDDAEAEVKLAEAELQQARESRQLARLEWQQQSSLLNLRTLRSPFDGVVVDQLLYPGEIVEPGGQKKTILKLAQLDPLRVHVILPLAAFGKIKPGMAVDVMPETPINGRHVGYVKIIDRLIDAASGTFGVFLELANPKLEVPAGVKCRAEFPIAPATAADARMIRRQ